MRKSRLPRPSQTGMRAAVRCRPCSTAASQGGAAPITSSPIQASKISPGRSRAAASPAAASSKPRNASPVAGAAGPRCMSEASQTGPCSTILFKDQGLLDDHVLDRHVLVEPAVAGLDALDLVDHLGAPGDLAEHGIAPAVRR